MDKGPKCLQAVTAKTDQPVPDAHADLSARRICNRLGNSAHTPIQLSFIRTILSFPANASSG